MLIEAIKLIAPSIGKCKNNLIKILELWEKREFKNETYCMYKIARTIVYGIEYVTILSYGTGSSTNENFSLHDI